MRMRNWNLVATTREEQYGAARALLDRLCATGSTRFYNVLVGRVDDASAFMDELHAAPGARERLSRVVPLTLTFPFRGDEEWNRVSTGAVIELSPLLSGKSFHVRAHWRGYETALHRQDEEQRLNEAVVAITTERGEPARVTYEDPDAFLNIETVEERGGASVFTREQLARWPLLHLD